MLEDNKVCEAARILKYVKGWTLGEVEMLCRRKKWQLEAVT